MSQAFEQKTASELAAAIRAREISSLELCDAYLQRIARLNPPLNAVVTLDPERARARARELDAALARGEAAGPLHGLPITIKDAYETAGLRSTGGAREWAEHVPSRNAGAVQRLIDAGAVVLGKTNVPAYSADVQTHNELFGTTNNPWDPTRTPGGSSGGATVAVACGMSAFELGSDIGGSIRTPCGWTGVYGHKPTHGIVPMRGHLPPGPDKLAEVDLGVGGPIARGAEDLALLLDVLAGPNDAHAVAYQLRLPPARAGKLRDFRVGVWLEDGDYPLDAAVAAVLDDVVRALERAGVQVERGAPVPDPLREIYADYLALLTPITVAESPPEALARMARRAADSGEDALVARVARAAIESHVEWLRVHERRVQLQARFAQFFRRCDVLLCPITPVAAIPHDQARAMGRRSIATQAGPRPYMDLLAWICPATACHLPATAAPVGRTAQGLPVGVQIVGPYLEDRTPLAFAALLRDVIGGYAPPPETPTVP